MCKSSVDRKILSVLQRPLQLVPQPFEYYAQQLGISVEKVIIIIQDYICTGIIRRFAGIVKHDRVGYLSNAMIAFEVDIGTCDSAGNSLSRFSFVTHCYRRTAYPDWPYNIYAMMHARNEEEFEAHLEELKGGIQYESMAILRTKKEYKKTLFQFPD